MTKKNLSKKEETYVRSLANIAAGAIEKGLIFKEVRDVNRRLDGKINELNTLFELSKEFNGVLEADRLIKLLIYSIMGHIGVSRYMLCLQKNGVMKVVASRIERPVMPALSMQFEKVKGPVIVDALTKKSDATMKALLQELGIHVLIPLQLQHETRGVIGLGEKMHGARYTDADLEFLTSVGNLAIVSLENARLFQEAIERQKLEDELLIAKEIQNGLLPARLPTIPHFDLAAMNISSKQVGGDYYDLIKIDQDRFVLAIGDVSGKGAPASLLMASLQATIRALVPLGLPLSDLTRRVNDLVCDNTRSDRFITFFWGILDASARTFNYVSAGHNPPYVFRANGRIERLDKGGIILGIMKNVVPYEDGKVTLHPGDVLVLFTDGVSEAMNADGEELGEEHIERIVTQYGDKSAQVLLSEIVERVKKHSKNVPQSDDITLLVAKVVD